MLNDQGQLTHTGSGLLRLDADSVTNTGGQVHGTGSGEVTLDRLDDVGEWKFNDALGFTLDQGLTLVAGDTITSATSLNLKMASLDNRGELLANDALAIHASGDITNHGLISTRGDLDVTARHLTQLDGRLASGGTSTYHLDGKLDNQGFLTGIGDITITTAHLDNHGTLGSQGNLNIDSSGRIDNRSDSLLFAGGDMTLFGTHLFNRYGEIYSRGNLDFARNDDHAMAERLENRSGTIEAEGNITLSALEFLNVKDAYEEVFELADREIATENYVAKRYRHWLGRNNNNGSIPDVWVLVSRMVFQDFSVTDILKNKVVVDSPGSQIVAGENLLIKSADFLNGNSLMAANGNVEIESDHFHNRGSSSTITTRVRQYGRDIEFLDGVQVYQVSDLKSGYAADIAKLEDIINGIYENNPKEAARRMLEQMEKEGPLSPGSSYLITDQRYDSGNGYSVPWLLYTDTESWNQPSGSSAPLPSFFADMALKSDTQAYETTGTLSHAMIQAGKQVTINASNSLQNGAIRNNTRTQINGNLGNSVTGGPVNSLDITLNRRSTDATPSSPPDGTGAYHDVPFERVSPTQLSSFRLPQGRYGLFVRNTSPQSRYLIETNPEFTSADQLMGSDYLLDKLDYTADGAYQLLGDGRYESRLIRDAVLANTGQRFLNDSLDDDYAQYRQLMDNAVAAKDALRLSVGVGLTPAQTAALTHDIVWLEEQQVDGQTVLAPVLYLAQVDERNVRGASLIQGRDIDLIAGGDLVNVGTIRADNDLTASTGGSILQGGLIDAGERLDLSAQDSIRNALAGEIRGGQVSLTATEGDIVNDRSAITAGYDKSYETYLGEGGLISARDGLALSAGRDIVNRAEIVSQGDADLQAGRDIVTEAVTDARHKASEYGIRQGSTRTTQLGASLTAGGDATLEAGRDVVVTASDIASEAALAVEAGRDIRLEAGEDTAHDWGVNMPLRARVDQRTTTQVGSQLTSVDDTRLSAGRDVRLTASEIDSGAGLAIAAGNDILLDAAENQTHTQTNERRRRSETRAVEQAGSELTAREDVALQAQRHITAIASRAEAGGNLALDAAGDLTLASAANVRHHESHTSTTDWTSRHVRQQGSNMVAGDTLTMRSGRDLRLIASDAEAGNDAFLIAGRDVELLAANDQDYSLYEKEESGLFSSSYQRDEINDIRAVGSRLESGNDLTVISGADQRYQGARLEAGNNLTLASGGTIHFEAASDFHTESHEERSGNFAWQSSQGEGRTDETLRQSQLIAKGNLVIQAADGIVAEVPEINAQTVSQTIDVMVEADPDLAWLKEMEERGDIDWRQVKEIHDSWEYEHSGLSGVAMLVIAIIVTYFTAGAASGLVASGAAAASLATTATVSAINNRGDLGDVFDDTFSSDAMKGYAVAAASAGITRGVMGEPTDTHQLDFSNAGDIARLAGERASQTAINAGVRTAIEGGSLSDNLEAGLDGVLTEVVAAVLFDAVGDQNLPSGSPQKIALHALAGGAVAEATGGDFRTGALAAGANEALVDHLAELVDNDPQLLVAASQITGIIAAELTDGDVNQGAEIAGYSTQYNRQAHAHEKEIAQQLAEQSDGKYTAEEIEQALRGMFNDELGESPGSNVVVDLHDLDAVDASYYDFGGEWLATPGGDGNTRHLVQMVPTDTSPELVDFIIEQTGGVSSPYRAMAAPTPSPRPEPKLRFPGSIAMAAGLPYNLNQTDSRTWAEIEQGQEALTRGIASLVAFPVSGPYAAATLTARGAAGLFATDAGFDALGQYVQGGEYRPGQTLMSGITALGYGPMAGGGILGNAALGGAAGGTLTAATNWMYDEDKSLIRSIGMGAVTGGAGTWFGDRIKGMASYIPSQVSVPYFQTPATFSVPLPSADTIGNTAQTVISNAPALLPGIDNEERQ